MIFATHSQIERKRGKGIKKVEKVTARKKIDGTNNPNTILMRFLTNRRRGETEKIDGKQKNNGKVHKIYIYKHINLYL